MNAALQALSNCPQLTRFMLDCSNYIHKPGLARSYWKLIKEIWENQKTSYVVPNGIANGIKNVCPIFRGYTQQDAQEFLRCFLDQLHEELKEQYTKDNNYCTPNNDVIMNDLSDVDSNSDADYETCDSGLSSEKSACGDDFNNNDDEMMESKGINSNPSIHSSSMPSIPQSSSPSLNSGNQFCLSNSSPRKLEKRKSMGYRSIISDIFDGRILSSVQCLKCDNVSTTKETFQDLSLPIPNRDHIYMLRAATTQNTLSKNDNSSLLMSSSNAGSNTNIAQFPNNVNGLYTWIWDWIDWVVGWIWGPTVSLQDCLSAFFSADELKGDNMYSCEKCKKLRNGVKYSKVLQLPEILSIHLKRFRHELMYSSKISSHVTFPLEGLDMSPYMARNCSGNHVTLYDLVAVICHHGTASSGHYTTYAFNQQNNAWYEFDDQYITLVDASQVANCEAYVLFYRKSNEEMVRRRLCALDLMKLSKSEPSLLHFYISKQWVNKFNTFAEPGPITNCDFLCEHGGVDPDKSSYVHELCTEISRSLWEYLHSTFGGGPTCTKLYVCQTCLTEKENLDRRRRYEYETVTKLNTAFRNQRAPLNVYAISVSWFKQWESFVTQKTKEPPGPIQNNNICNVKASGQTVLKVGADCASISEEMWTFLHNTYGGGPQVSHHLQRKMSSSHTQPQKQVEQQQQQQHQYLNSVKEQELQHSSLEHTVESSSSNDLGNETNFDGENGKLDPELKSEKHHEPTSQAFHNIIEHANERI